LAGVGASAARKDVPGCFDPILASIGKAVVGYTPLAPLLIHHTASPVIQVRFERPFTL
jgi:hypothetical protein